MKITPSKIILKSMALTILIVIILWLALLCKINGWDFWYYFNLTIGVCSVYYLSIKFFENKKGKKK